jgi:peroxiredoxin
MSLTPSSMVSLGTELPGFALPDVQGQSVSNTDFAGNPMLVAFWCNHCPYVIHVQDRFVKLARDWQEKGLAVVAINANDAENYPDDSPANMKKRAKNAEYSFPYLCDETQVVAKSFEAACTPDFFLYDSEHKLVYRGQFDGTRPGSGEATGSDLSAAIESLLESGQVSTDQVPSAGCNIKWK